MNILTLHIIAEGMASVVERGYKYTKRTGFPTSFSRDIRDIFGDVPSENQEEVYEMLLELLRIKDVPFDNKLANF